MNKLLNEQVKNERVKNESSEQWISDKLTSEKLIEENESCENHMKIKIKKKTSESIGWKTNRVKITRKNNNTKTWQ